MTFFYSYVKHSKRHKSWYLRHLAMLSSLPRVIMGDFNELLMASEKRGHFSHPQRLMEDFNKALQDYGLQDLGYSSHPFTWEKW